MVKIDYIREFITLAETLSFTKTAELTYVTQPALTRHIAALEEDLGGKLLYRDTRNVALTPAGAAAYVPLKKLLTEYTLVREQTESLSSGKEGTLRISSPYYWAEDFIEPAIREYSVKHPGVELKIMSCQPQFGIDDIMSGRSDVLVYMSISEASEEIRYIPYATERFCIACDKDHPLAQYDEIELTQIKGYPITSFDFGETIFKGYNEHLLDLLSKRDIYPGAFSISQQIDTVGLNLQGTENVCFLPYGIRHMDRSYLKFIPLTDDDCTVEMCIYYLTSNDNPFIPGFVQAAKAAFSFTP